MVLKNVAELEKILKKVIEDLRKNGFVDETIIPTLILKVKEVARKEGVRESD